jgi:drug/metabolite transporter (DMT)-like permease
MAQGNASAGGWQIPAPVELVVAAAIYGLTFPVNRMAAEVQWPALLFPFMQNVLAGLCLLLWMLLRGQSFPLTLGHVRGYVVIGGLAAGLPIGLLVWTAPHVDASVMTLVLCLSPILTLLFGVLLGIERFDRATLLGMVFGTAGIALITIPGAGVISRDAVSWFLLSLLAPAMFAGANQCARWLRPEGASTLAMAAGTLLGAAVVCGLVMLVTGAFTSPFALPATAVLPLVLAVVINALFYWMFFDLVGRLGPSRFSLFNYLAVAAGIIWSLALFHERPAALFWVALALMLAGMYIALSRKPAG